MSNIRLTGAEMFAIEVTRAVLAQKSLLVGVNLNTSWKYLDIETHFQNSSYITLLFELNGSGVHIRSYCEVYGRYGTWSFGICTITLVDIDPNREWSFNCELLPEGEIVVIEM
jgi:hypothetical protein